MNSVADDLTTPDRAARARMAFELYQGAYEAAHISDLIGDLMHLADVDGHPGGAARAARHALRDYMDETPTMPPVYVAQMRPKGGDWITVGEGDDSVDLRDVANLLWRQLQKHGFRTGEIALHIDDIVRGDVLTAENGTEFRAFKTPHYSG
ncbi:hypothetical protein ACFU7X_45885 [Streptomyces chartreusis]|uniref:hypothetical protein n=1 Tax=Streptomyces chartreusis TaxID=1969 RepID=UPI00367E616E